MTTSISDRKGNKIVDLQNIGDLKEGINTSPVNVGFHIIRLAYTGDKIEYIGLALPGSATSSAIWQIRKLAYTGDNLTSVLIADGNVNFDNIWDDRASLSYS